MRGRSSWIVVITENQRQLAKHRIASGFHCYGFVFAHLTDNVHARMSIFRLHMCICIYIYIYIYIHTHTRARARAANLNIRVCQRVRVRDVERFYKLSRLSVTDEHVSLGESGRRAQARLRRLLRPVSQQWTARIPALGIVIYIKSPDKPRLTPHHEPLRRGTGRLSLSIQQLEILFSSLADSPRRAAPLACTLFPFSLSRDFLRLAELYTHAPHLWLYVFSPRGLQFANVSRPISC